MSIAKILGGIQRDVEESECRITSGVVESVSPLRIKKDKLSITKDYLIVSPIVQLVGLKKGQKVVLLQANKQQTYYILEILNESVEQVISKLIKTNDATLEASLKAYVNNKVKTDVPVGALFTDTTYSKFSATKDGLVPKGSGTTQYLRADGSWQVPPQTSLEGLATEAFVNDKVKTNVPTNALFTDTITTVNGKTGAIAKADITALGIPAQDTVTSINGKTGAITKADITALGIPTQDTVTTVNGKTGTVTPQDLANAVSASFASSSHSHSGADITSGTVPVARLGMTVSKATNGYVKLPDGVFLQWGRVDFTGTAASYKTLTFPIAFPSACRSIVGSFAVTSGEWPQWTTVFGSVSRTGARAYVRDGDNSGTGLTDSTKGYVYWLAMGY